MAWSFTATYILIKLVDWTVGIRLTTQDEISGCDPTEHDVYPEDADDLPLVSNTAKLSSVTMMPNNFGVTSSPMPNKYVMNSSLYESNLDSLNKRRVSNINDGYVRDWRQKLWRT